MIGMKEPKTWGPPNEVDTPYRPQGGERDAPHALITLEVVTFETATVPLLPGSGRSIGEAVNDALLDAQRA